MGAYTTPRVIVMAMIGDSNRREEASAASLLDMPSRKCRATFSTTTIASSTTKPTDSTTASMVSRLSENPMRDMAAVAPRIEIGMVRRGTKALRIDPINATTTSPTRKTVSPSVRKISLTASRM